MQPKLFISYSSKIRPIVEELASDLEGLGYEVWFDPELTGGRDWWKDICAAIRACDVFVFALTHEALDSHACQLEYSYAYDLKKRLLPVLLGNVNIALLPKTLQKIQAVDYQIRDKQQLGMLNRALMRLPAVEPMPDDVPEPEAPLSPFANMAERINGPLQTNEQKLLVYELEELLTVQQDTVATYELLQKLRNRKEDLLVSVYQRVEHMITQYEKQHQQPEEADAKDSVAARNEKVFTHREAVYCVAFSPDGQHILTGTSSVFSSQQKTMQLWEISSGQEVQVLAGETKFVGSAAFSPDGQYVIAAGGDYAARLWDVRTGTVIQRFTDGLASLTSFVRSVAFSPDGQCILTGSEDGTARLWDITTGDQILKFTKHKAAISSVVFSPDGRAALTGSRDRTARLWDTSTGQQIREFIQSTDALSSVAFSPDGQSILMGSEGKAVRLWNVATGEELQDFTGHKAAISSIAFSPDACYVLTGSGDKTARLWDATTGKELKRFTGHRAAVSSVVFSPDGHYVLTGSKDRTARLWKLEGIS